MSFFMPAKMFLTKGKGVHEDKLVSFDQALREAGLSAFNLVKVSSILPPRCQIIARKEGVSQLQPGQIVFVVLSEISTADNLATITASIGIALPSSNENHGYLYEFKGSGLTEKEAGKRTEKLAAIMLNKAMQENKTGEKKNGDVNANELIENSIQTRSITQLAPGIKGKWTTALAAAVFVM
ncbi:MAG: pyruvoyl-dependent arginine decarboxylase [Acidobacteriota bacterium]